MSQELKRTVDGRFPKGVSGNPAGRPKGSLNGLTLLKKEIEHEMRTQAAPRMAELLDKAFEMAMEGNTTIMKALLDYHMKADIQTDKVQEKTTINISALPNPDREKHANVVIDGDEPPSGDCNALIGLQKTINED